MNKNSIDEIEYKRLFCFKHQVIYIKDFLSSTNTPVMNMSQLRYIHVI